MPGPPPQNGQGRCRGRRSRWHRRYCPAAKGRAMGKTSSPAPPQRPSPPWSCPTMMTCAVNGAQGKDEQYLRTHRGCRPGAKPAQEWGGLADQPTRRGRDGVRAGRAHRSGSQTCPGMGRSHRHGAQPTQPANPQGKAAPERQPATGVDTRWRRSRIFQRGRSGDPTHGRGRNAEVGGAPTRETPTRGNGRTQCSSPDPDEP
jgi:hypothetical protein